MDFGQRRDRRRRGGGHERTLDVYLQHVRQFGRRDGRHAVLRSRPAHPQRHVGAQRFTSLVVIGRAGAAFDNLGDQYQSISYNETGTTAIISNTWFDGDGNVIRTQAGGTQEWTETLYDGLGDAVDTYDGVGGGSDYSDFASSLGQINVNSDQTVLTQTADEYDNAGDQTFETDYNRLPGETATGADLERCPGHLHSRLG